MSKEKKITAVQWLIDQLSEIHPKAFKIALDMEREQIINAHGDKMRKSAGTGNYLYWYNGEDYYNDNFKS